MYCDSITTKFALNLACFLFFFAWWHLQRFFVSSSVGSNNVFFLQHFYGYIEGCFEQYCGRWHSQGFTSFRDMFNFPIGITITFSTRWKKTNTSNIKQKTLWQKKKQNVVKSQYNWIEYERTVKKTTSTRCTKKTDCSQDLLCSVVLCLFSFSPKVFELICQVFIEMETVQFENAFMLSFRIPTQTETTGKIINI